MNSSRKAVLRVLAATVPLMPLVVLAGGAPAPVEIKISPRVGRTQDVVTTVTDSGLPMIVVKSDLPNEPWWVQNVPRSTGPKQFGVRLIFGNERTPPGSKFHVVALLLPNAASAAQYHVGQQLTELPGLPTSSKLIVTSQGGLASPDVESIPTSSSSQVEKGKAAVAVRVVAPTVAKPAPRTASVDEDDPELHGDDGIVSIVTPKTETSVLRVVEITGKVAEGHTPVVVVRPLSPEKLWRVQSKPTLTDDLSFKGKIVVGSVQAAEGTRFRVTVLAFKDAESAAAIKVGSSLKQFPEGVPVSSDITVTLRNSKAEAKKPQPLVQPKTADVGKEQS